MTIAEIKKALECCHTMAVKCDECPLWERKGDWTDGKDCDDVLHEEILKVWDNMIPIGAVEQIKWERDTAMKQLNEHGIPFCGVADDVVKVVRCKDCIHWSNDSIGYCKYHEIYPSRHDLDDFFCADGERKENRNEID